MLTFAKYKSIKTPIGHHIFRYNTEFQSVNGPGEVLGLIVMMNPGDARPDSDMFFDKLCNSEHSIDRLVLTQPDRTMSKAIRLIETAFEINNIALPEKYTFHVENLFNLREKRSKKAIKYANELLAYKDILFKTRKLNPKYKFLFAAWGNVEINQEKQNVIMKYPNLIKVHKFNYKKSVRESDYPVHVLYMNTDYFIEAAMNRLK